MTVSSKSAVLYHRNPQYAACPSCKAFGTLRRSRSRNMYEQIVRKITFLKTYRCKECGWRGLKSTVVLTKKSLRSIIIYVILILVTAYFASHLILNYALN